MEANSAFNSTAECAVVMRREPVAGRSKALNSVLPLFSCDTFTEVRAGTMAEDCAVSRSSQEFLN